MFYINRLPIILLLISLSLGSFSVRADLAGDFLEALQYGDKGKYKKKILLLEKIANIGYLPAQLELGSMYRFGDDKTPVDLSKAIIWYEKAARSGGIAIQSIVADLYLKQNNIKKSFFWYEILAKKFDANAQYYMAYFYAYGKSVEQDATKAKEWLELASANGYGMAQYMLSVFYKEGFGVEKNEEKALFWLMKASRAGYALAQYELSGYYYFFKKNNTKAVEWLKKSYIQNLPQAIVVYETLNK